MGLSFEKTVIDVLIHISGRLDDIYYLMSGAGDACGKDTNDAVKDRETLIQRSGVGLRNIACARCDSIDIDMILLHRTDVFKCIHPVMLDDGTLTCPVYNTDSLADHFSAAYCVCQSCKQTWIQEIKKM